MPLPARKIPWTVFHACAAVLTASAALLVFLLRPLWYEMDVFIAGMTGVMAPWSVMLLALAAASTAYCLLGYFLVASGVRRKSGAVSVLITALLVLLWSGVLAALVRQSATGLPSFCPAPRLFLAYAALSAALAIVLGIGKRPAGLVAAGLCVLLAIGWGAGAVAARAAEQGRRPAHVERPHEDWSARWVTAAERQGGRSEPNTWICFRKSFSIGEAPRSARIRIAADTKYRLWVNGALAVMEGGLKRGPAPRDAYFDVVDIAPYMREGENLIAILLWYFGKDGFAHADSGTAGLIVDGGAEWSGLDTDQAWKARQHPAYYTPSGQPPNFRLAEPDVGFDARKDIGSWTAMGYDDSAWKACAEMGRPPCAPWGNLVERPIPQFRFGPIQEYANSETIGQGNGSIVKCSLPYNAQVTPYLRIRARAGDRIGIRTDHYTGGGALGVRAEYTARGGEQEYEAPGWMNGHVVLYEIPRGVEVLSLGYRESGYAADFSGSFACGDPFYARLWEKARRTLYLCMRDNYMDCPDRERAQWWNAGIDVNQAFYCLDRSADALGRKAMFELVDWARADGSLYSPVPSGNWDIELPLAMLASVGERGFWTYYMHTGDGEALARVYPAVMRYLELWDVKDGLALERKGEWSWGDWGDDIDMPLLANCWYYLALKGALRMAETLDRGADARSIRSRMAAFEGSFDSAFWNGAVYRSRSYTGDTDDRSNALAVVAGLVPPERYGAIRAVLTSEFHASTFMESYVLEALFMMGFDEDALGRMKSRFAPMVESPLTTLWEGWEIGSQTYGGGTANHAWSGGGLTLLSRYAAGVYPTLPGWEEFRVVPHEGSLSYIECSVPSPKGMVSVSIRGGAVEVTVPPGTRAVVGLHSRNADGGSLGGVTVNGASPKSGTIVPGEDGRYLFIRVPAGTWRFEAKYVP